MQAKSSSFIVLVRESQTEFELDPLDETEDIRNTSAQDPKHTYSTKGPIAYKQIFSMYL